MNKERRGLEIKREEREGRKEVREEGRKEGEGKDGCSKNSSVWY